VVGGDHDQSDPHDHEDKDADYSPSDPEDHDSDLNVINVDYTLCDSKLDSGLSVRVAAVANSSTLSHTVPLYANATLHSKTRSAHVIFDTGAGCSLISYGLVNELPPSVQQRMVPSGDDSKPTLTSATGGRMNKVGIINLRMKIGNTTLQPINLIVVKNMDNDIILGNDVLIQRHLFGDINVANQSIIYLGNNKSEVLPLIAKTGGHEARPMNPAPAKTPRSEPRRLEQVGSVRVFGDHVLSPNSETTLTGSSVGRIKGMGQFRDKHAQDLNRPRALSVRRHPDLRANIKVVHVDHDIDDDLMANIKPIKLKLINNTETPIKIVSGTRVAMVDAVWDGPRSDGTGTRPPQQRVGVNTVFESRKLF